MNIGESIKNCRNIKKLTQKQLSELTNIPVISIGRYERGENSPDFSSLLKIAQALDITIDELIKGEIENSKKHWEAIKKFDVKDIKEMIEDLKKITLTKSDKKILDNQEKILFRITYQYERLLQPLAKELLTGDIDIIYGDKLKSATNMTVENLKDIESTLKAIKDKYI